MGRTPSVAARLSVAGAVALVAGTTMIIGVALQTLSAPAFADTTPFEMLCAGTPVGNIVINDVVVSGSISPAAPAPGQQFSLTGVQVSAPIPALVAQAARAAGNGSLSGSITSTVVASGATPASLSTGALEFSAPIPNPPPSAGLTLEIPSSPVTLGPFTATSSNISLSLGSVTTFSVQDGVIGPLNLSCAAYPNDAISQAGLTSAIPPGVPISPFIATAGQVTAPPTTPQPTGAYELYCPHTPVGDLVFNDVTTSATVPGPLAAGDAFEVTGYRTTIPIPAGVVSAASGLGNGGFTGEAASAVDVYGAGPGQISTGSMNFDLPIPTPVPSAGLDLEVPTTAMSVGPFTPDGGPVIVAQDQAMQVVAALSSKAFTMSCTAFPNDSVPTSGSTGTAPHVPPIRPVIAVASATGTTTTTSPTTPVPGSGGPGTVAPGSPYELYCPRSPVGNLVLNDTTTTATITPSSLKEGDQFQLSNLQTQFSIPQAVAQQAEKLGVTQLTGDMSLFLDTTGVYNDGVGFSGGGGSVAALSSGSSSSSVAPSLNPALYLPYPGPYPLGSLDMHFDVTLPDPVPASGVQFTATPPSGTQSAKQQFFSAMGGPIQIAIGGVNLDATEFGDRFGMFCSTFPNDTQPTGLSTTYPQVAPVQPVIATGTATLPPPVQGGEGPYELYCPGTPVGAIALNNVTTTASLSPADPAAGTQFQVTGYQNTVTVPAQVVQAAAAVGNTALQGTVTTAVDVTGATPASISTGTMSFDVPIPSVVPPSGLQLVVPSPAASVGPFTASGGGIVVTQDASVVLTLADAGVQLNLHCTTYPDNSAPTGIAFGPPSATPTAPVIALGDGATLPPPPTVPAGAYELYCPGTPVGNIVLNDVSTSGTISPADPAAGQQFDVTGYQTQVSLPSSIATAAAALGNSAITGQATVSLDASGATPASVSSGAIPIDAPIPSPVPSSGLALELPSTPMTVGPFTASGGPITITQNPDVQLGLTVSGSTLNLTCHPYANNSEPSGIVVTAPPGAPEPPVVATAGTATGSTAPPDTGTTLPAPITTLPAPITTLPTSAPVTTSEPGTTAPLPTSEPGTTAVATDATGTTAASTTAPPVVATSGVSTTTAAPGIDTPSGTVGATTSAGADPGSGNGSSTPSVTAAPVVQASSGVLAFTGPGARLHWMLLTGAALVVIGLAMLALVDAPRRALRAISRRGAPSAATKDAVGPPGASRSPAPPVDLWYR